MHVEIVRLLLEAKADPRIPDDVEPLLTLQLIKSLLQNGWTPLHVATECRGTETAQRQCEVIKLLVERDDGAKLDAKNKVIRNLDAAVFYSTTLTGRTSASGGRTGWIGGPRAADGDGADRGGRGVQAGEVGGEAGAAGARVRRR